MGAGARTTTEGSAIMADTNKAITVIGPDTHIKGEMHFDAAARILGTFEGKITAKGEVHVAEGARCNAEVEAARVMVDGTIEGDIAAKDRVELSSKARVAGNISAATLVVAAGASFMGHCRIGVAGTGTATATSKPRTDAIDTDLELKARTLSPAAPSLPGTPTSPVRSVWPAAIPPAPSVPGVS